MVPPSFVPETMRALDLLRSFLTRPQGMAIVVDEFGGTEGIVTISDIIEDILRDAAPLGEADLDIEPLPEGRYLVNGRARLDDLSEQLGFDFDASGIDTIGGYVFTQLGRVPEVGTQLETPRLRITVRRVNRRRIEELLLEKTACVDGDSENGELP
jgi:CBS domain containing-hemolysin-like protein